MANKIVQAVAIIPTWQNGLIFLGKIKTLLMVKRYHLYVVWSLNIVELLPVNVADPPL